MYGIQSVKMHNGLIEPTFTLSRTTEEENIIIIIVDEGTFIMAH